MNLFKNRGFAFFTTGAVFGFFLAVAVVLYTKNSTYFSKNENSEEASNENEFSNSFDKTKKRIYQKQVADSAEPISVNSNETIVKKSKVTQEEPHKEIEIESNPVQTPEEEEDVGLIKRDQMIESSELNLIYWKNEKEVDIIDSTQILLEKKLGIRQKNKLKKVQVEYWTSPLNFKGYKRGKNKLILFGILPEPIPQLFADDEGLILHSDSSFYEIEMSEEFQPYVQVKDSLKLNELVKQRIEADTLVHED